MLVCAGDNPNAMIWNKGYWVIVASVRTCSLGCVNELLDCYVYTIIIASSVLFLFKGRRTYDY
jgi:hypothetical protein